MNKKWQPKHQKWKTMKTNENKMNKNEKNSRKIVIFQILEFTFLDYPRKA